MTEPTQTKYLTASYDPEKDIRPDPSVSSDVPDKYKSREVRIALGNGIDLVAGLVLLPGFSDPLRLRRYADNIVAAINAWAIEI